MPIYVPKQIVTLQPTISSPLFFLAGPIRGGGDWQADMAEKILEREPSAMIACPSRWEADHRLAHSFHQPFSKAYNRQLDWERHYLQQAGLEPKTPGCVIFWLGLENEEDPHPGPEPYAMDTRRELGKFTAYMEIMRDGVRVVVGGHPDFYGLDVISYELNRALGPPFPLCQDMDDLVNTAFKRVARSI